MKRALFFPSYFGNGFGHVGRCLALADEVARQGWAVAIALSGPHVPAVLKGGHRVYRPWFPTRPHPSPTHSPAYTCVPDASWQVLRDGFTHPWRAHAAILEALWMIRKFRPNVVIGDFSLVAWIAGRCAGLPVVQIAQAISHPLGSRIIWWREPLPGIMSPNVEPLLASIAHRWQIEPMHDAKELLQGDAYLIPGIPELDPVPVDSGNTHYVGILSPRSTSADGLPLSLQNLPRPILYVTLGGGAGSAGNVAFFEMLNQALEGTRWSAVVSTGRRFNPADLPTPPPNIVYHQWIPGRAMIEHSDLVIFHGGHNTMMETVQAGIPSIVIPFHSEQEGNGQRLAACGAAGVLSPVPVNAMQLVRHRWVYGTFATWVQATSTLTAEQLRETIAMALEDRRYQESATALRASSSQYSGALAAVEWIDALIA